MEENNKDNWKSVYLHIRAGVAKTKKATLFKFPRRKGEETKYFWYPNSCIRKVGKFNLCLRYTDNMKIHIYEEYKNEKGERCRKNQEDITGDELKIIFSEMDTKIEKSYNEYLKSKNISNNAKEDKVVEDDPFEESDPFTTEKKQEEGMTI